MSFIFCVLFRFLSFFFGTSIIQPDDVFRQCHLREVPVHQ